MVGRVNHPQQERNLLANGVWGRYYVMCWSDVRNGNPNPVYYKMAAGEYGATGSVICNSANGNSVAPTCTFYDVTQGDMDVNCTGSQSCYVPSGRNGVLSTSRNSYSKAYGTTTGWDFATGIGTVNAYNLVTNWPK